MAPSQRMPEPSSVFCGQYLPLVKEVVDYSLAFSGCVYVNKGSGSDNFSLLQNLRYSWSIKGKNGFCYSGFLIHNLGLQMFPDSICRFYPDDNQLTLKADVPVLQPVSFNLSLVLSSRLFNDFSEIYGDSGNFIRKMNTGLFTPFVGSLSAGLGCQMKPGSVSIGLSALRFTLIGDKRIYAFQDKAFGVSRDEQYLLEYGLSLQVNAGLRPWKWLHWSCDIYVFKKYDDVFAGNLKNMFGIQLSRYIRLNIQSGISCDEKVSKKLQMEHVVSLGFGFLH